MECQIINPRIETYLDQLQPPLDALFIELEEMAKKSQFPFVGPQVGQLLEMLARMIDARRVMELGSGFGYSGLWFARALPEDGFLLLSDFEESNRQLAETVFRRAGKQDMMQFRVGDALSLLAEPSEPYDIIFNDIDKELYPQTIEPVYRRLRTGGLFITDNTLWYGKVTETDRAKMDEPTAAVDEFNRRLRDFQGFKTSWLPLRDGLSVSIKI